MIVAIVAFELTCALFLATAIGLMNSGDMMIAPVEVWFACATLQLTIHYRPSGSFVRNALAFVMAAMLIASLAVEDLRAPPYFNQVLFVAAAATLPQLLLEWSAKATGRRTWALLLACICALPLGLAAWSLANIGIVKVKAQLAAEGEPYCLFVPDGSYLGGEHDYDKAPADWKLSGWSMVSPWDCSGSGDCRHLAFHALLLTQSNKLFNWSYRSQRFEKLSDERRRLYPSVHLTCR